MPGPNQIGSGKQADFSATAAELLAASDGTVTEQGLRTNINVGIGYIEAWLRGIGCVPLHHLMEDAATAEISRAQVWQWQHHKAKLPDGRPVDDALIRDTVEQELGRTAQMVGEERFEAGRYQDAARLFLDLALADQFTEFLTLPAYDMVVTEEGVATPTAS